MSWKWAAASARGTSHEKSGTRLQDAKFCFAPTPALSPFVAVVSDGAGSASFGGQGASLLCRSVSQHARRFFASSSSLPSTVELEDWVDSARDQITVVANRRQIPVREFAATMVLAIAGPNEVVIAHIGDGCVVVRDRATNEWLAPSWPQHGEYASTTFFITDTDLRLRITREPISSTAVAMFTDGIERLVLDMSASRPFGQFFDSVIRPLDLSESGLGKDRTLSAQLKAYLSGSTINARTDDDKTLVLAARR